MTIEISRFMNALERAWDAHRDALLVTRDPERALAGMGPDPSVTLLPIGTGAEGTDALRRFYVDELIPFLPGDLSLTRISRTVDRWRLVDELRVAFTHDVELPWLLPGVPATGRRADVLAIAVVSFPRGELSGARVLWDLAGLCEQLGVATPASGSAAARATAR